MAATRRKLQDQDDYISHYGSISGETFASRRSRRDCSSMRMNSIDMLAKNLREYHAKQDPDGIRQLDTNSIISSQKRFNNSFHHYRLLVVMMGGMSVGLMLLLRYSITISILRMVNQTHMYLEEHPNRTIEDFLEEGYSLGGEFKWNNEIIAIIMSWYMITYTLPQMPAAKLSAKMGCRLSTPLALAICAISSLLTPYSAYMGWEYVVALRMLNGLGASALMPMMLNLVETWMRYNEISLGLSMAQIVNATMCTLTPLVSGYLAAYHWSLSFYVPGAFTLVFCVLWLILISDSPETSKFISAKELIHIHSCDDDVPAAAAARGGVNNNKQAEKSDQDDKTMASREDDELDYKADSWLQIFKVPSFYAYIILWCFYCSSYSGFTFVLPTYLRQFLKIKVAQNGFYCFLIQIGSILSVLWPHPLLRALQNCGLSITVSRRISHALCCFMVAATWIFVGAFHETQLPMLFLNRAFHAGGNDILVTGSLMSNYAKAGLSSVAFSLINTVGNLSIVGTSTMIGWVLDYTNQSREGWCWIYVGLAIGQIVMFMIFVIFIDSQPIKFKNKKRKQDIEFNQKVEQSKTQQDANIEAVNGKRRSNNFDDMKKTVEKVDLKDD